MGDQIPRRAQLHRLHPVERAIWDATQGVEALGADIRLTDAVVLLQAAREAVADFIEGVNPDARRCVDYGCQKQARHA